MEEIISEESLYSQQKMGITERYLGLSLKSFFVGVVIVISLGVYMQILLFGDSSLEVLLELEAYETYYKEEIYRLKSENAQLQKEYFELKELAPKSQK